jgi:hypothetical protein
MCRLSTQRWVSGERFATFTATDDRSQLGEAGVTARTPEDGNANYELVLPFDSDDPEFCRGFEAGRLWERMKIDAADWTEMIHATNTEMVMRMAVLEDREFRAEIVDDEWIQVFVS